MSPPPSNHAMYCNSGVVIPPPSHFNTQSARVPTTLAHLLFLHSKKIPASHTTRGGTPTESLAPGTNREGKERVKGKASRIQCSRIGSALVCVRRNVQHREIKLPKSTRFALITAVMAVVPTVGSTGCPVTSPPFLSQIIQSHEKSPESQRAQGVPRTISFALGANREGKRRVEGKASRIQSSRKGSALVCVRRTAQHRELNLAESTQFVLSTVRMVAVSTSGPTGCPVSHPSFSSQNIQSHEKSPTHEGARSKTQFMSLALDTNPEGKERVKGKAGRIQSSRIGSRSCVYAGTHIIVS